MARPRRKTAEQAETPVYGPYALVDEVNSLSFGSNPIVVLEAGQSFTTDNPQLAALLDESPHVRRSEA